MEQYRKRQCTGRVRGVSVGGACGGQHGGRHAPRRRRARAAGAGGRLRRAHHAAGQRAQLAQRGTYTKKAKRYKARAGLSAELDFQIQNRYNFVFDNCFVVVIDYFLLHKL